MRITKRQLKRIIREEYSRLKRRGLIRESHFDHDMMADLEEFEDRLSIACDGKYQRGELTDALENDMYEGDGEAFGCQTAIDICPDQQLKQEILRWCKRMLGEGGDPYELESDMY